MLELYFNGFGCDVKYLQFSEIDFSSMNFKDEVVLYTSSEENKGFYKQYIEDIVFGLYQQGAILIPNYKHLRAHHNKSYMEILRKQSKNDLINNLDSYVFGSFEEYFQNKDKFNKKDKWVIKPSSGAGSHGISLANNNDELNTKVKKVSCSFSILSLLVNIKRKFIDKNYKFTSQHQRKFIIQEFIPNMKYDWKVLVFYDKYYIFERPVRKNDFRASGSGPNFYKYGSKSSIPIDIFVYSKKVFDIFSEPIIAIDLMYDGNEFYLVEFQFLYFGTYGQVRSDCFFCEVDNKWLKVDKVLSLEEVYAESIAKYLQGKGLC